MNGGRLFVFLLPNSVFSILLCRMSDSLSKAKLSYFRKFLQKKMRVNEGLFLIEGWHLLDEAMKSGVRLEALVFDESARRDDVEDALLDEAILACGEVFEASANQMSQISDTKTSQGVAALVGTVGVSLEAFLEVLPNEGPLRLVALDGVADPGNCGAIIRACDWFGIDGVLLGAGSSELENGKTARATMGGLFHLPVAVGVDLPTAFEALCEAGVSCVTTELNGARSLEGFEFPERATLVIGNEARGVSKEISKLADERVFVPSFGKGESLNAAAATAVFLASWRM